METNNAEGILTQSKVPRSRDLALSLLLTAFALTGFSTAQAQTGGPAPSIKTGTVYTGDVINGKKVASSLDTAELEPGKKHLLYFQGVQMSTGQHWYVSVIVAKGARPGKRITLTSGVHGDEMSSVHTVQTVMGRLNAAEMSGTVMAVLDVARPALESMQRRWPSSGRGIELTDMNRAWPGDENGLGAAAFNIGEMRIPDVKTMMMLYPVSAIWDNATYPGVLQRAYTDAGIPCFTPEVGAARRLDPDAIALFDHPWGIHRTARQDE